LAALQEELARLEAVPAGGVPGEQLAQHAHTLKGGAATIGAHEIVSLAEEIEAAAREKPRLEVAELRRVNVLVRELGVRVARLQTVEISEEQEPSPIDPSGPPPKRILCVEDDPAILKLVEILLRREPNVTVDRATSGREGLEAILESQPDLVLLDVRLPDMDGRELIERLRANEETRELPVVVVSAEAGRQLNQLREAGADAFLPKPIETERFFEIVRVGLGRQ
jgi:CheY-like chemotaxis protein